MFNLTQAHRLDKDLLPPTCGLVQLELTSEYLQCSGMYAQKIMKCIVKFSVFFFFFSFTVFQYFYMFLTVKPFLFRD